LARRLDAEIISVDSMKVYRGMDIGTAKPSSELRQEIRYHLIDILDPWEDFSVGDFLPRVLRTVREVEGRGGRVVLQGGTAFYLHALLEGLFVGPQANWDLRRQLYREAEGAGLERLYGELSQKDPEAAHRIHPHDRRRIVRALEVIRQSGRKLTDLWKGTTMQLDADSYRCFGIQWSRSELYQRVNSRVDEMAKRGIFEETQRLLESPRGLGRTATKCIGYRQIIEALETGESREETVARIQRDTRRFAKQQLTWFRRFPIHWLQTGSREQLVDGVLGELSRQR
jgi:tRNA dimethylallyltransferase